MCSYGQSTDLQTGSNYAICAGPVHPARLPNIENGGEPCWVRTSDLLIKSQLLYRLS